MSDTQSTPNLSETKLSPIVANVLYLFYAPSPTDAGFKQRHAAHGKAHLAHMGPMIANKTAKLAGVTVSPQSIGKTVPEMDVAGVMILFEAESLEWVQSFIKEDPFYVHNVWDQEKVVIQPLYLSSATPLIVT
ncbi:hypothetical protein OF83DRAFT_1172669 [Amylostereum chailletii]|nr:hypothetical protein OF83DRAFT_1172669 [Amylostereum chailletii]